MIFAYSKKFWVFLSKTCGSSHFLTIAFDTLCFGHKNGLIWRFPKRSGNWHNSQKWGREHTIFEASFSALQQGNFKDDQNSDFLDHPNGQNHIIEYQWDGLGPLPWKFLVLGVRPILTLPTSLKCVKYEVRKLIRFVVPQNFLKDSSNYPPPPSKNTGSAKIHWVHFEKQFSTFFR